MNAKALRADVAIGEAAGARHTPGPWKALPHQTHDGRYWTVVRSNGKAYSGRESLLTKRLAPRRFGSPATAKAAADKANAPITKVIGSAS
jgi:hypothetical protein